MNEKEILEELKKSTLKTAVKIIAGAGITAAAAYIGVGGMLCYGILSKKACNKHPEELLKAKENPENYPNLIVRVGGYSDYFVNLNAELQDNVIKRTFMDV